MIILDSNDIRRFLPLKECTSLMRQTMSALSSGETTQMLRQILPVPGGMFGIMGGTLPDTYGSKLISAVKTQGRPSHQGAILLFDPDSGAPAALVDATSITGIRTACASAMATEALASPDADSLAIIGTGHQAYMHAHAICAEREIRRIAVWGRDVQKAEALAARLTDELGVSAFSFASPAEAARDSRIVCTVTSAAEPILGAEDVAPGTHINVVGSSHAGPREIEDSLVTAARFFGDSRESVLSQGAELIHAREAGLIDDTHFLGEIGEVLLGRCAGRTERSAITIYKSLGHIAQDLAAAQHVLKAASTAGAGYRVAF